MTLANWQAVAELPGGDSPRDRRGGHPIAAGATRGAGGRRRQRAGLACSALIVAVGLAASLARGTQAAERQWLSGAGLRDKIDSVLHATRYERQMSLQQNAAWQIMHGVLAFGRDFEVLDGDKSVIPENGLMIIPTKVIDKSNVDEFRQEMQKLLAQ